MLDKRSDAFEKILHELTDNFVPVMVLQRLPDGSDEVCVANALLCHYFDHLK